ncbi:MAG: hypothetical protein RLZZ584_1815 [Pseudomonadota bacterium]|jgi:hypothetical protein
MTLIRTALLALGLFGASAAALAHDYPTVERVLYVQSCMRDHPGPAFEMVNKCSCAIDKLAEQIVFDDYVSLSTVANAITIGGERGAVLREAEPMQELARKFRKLNTDAKKSCFIRLD